MAIFLVDMEFREKAKQVLTSREVTAIIFFLLFALVPWVEVMEMVRTVGNSTMMMEDGEAGSQVSSKIVFCWNLNFYGLHNCGSI